MKRKSKKALRRYKPSANVEHRLTKLEDAVKKLKDTIRATLPAEATLSD